MPALALQAAAAVTLLAALGVLLGQQPLSAPVGGTSGRAPPPSGPAPCPRGMLPDDGTCLPLPSAAATPEPVRNDDSTTIELLPDRPVDYSAYRLPSAVQRAEPGGAGALLHHKPGAPVQALALEGQVGPAELRRDAGTPKRLVALYTVRRADSERRYLVLLDHLRMDLASDVLSVAPGARLGRVVPGPLGSVLELSVRQLRHATDAALSTAQLLDDAHSIPCDPRNVLERQR
ncbi:MAG: hypothetical protein ABW217_07635 [Polyangiaceae bacterium]